MKTKFLLLSILLSVVFCGDLKSQPAIGAAMFPSVTFKEFATLYFSAGGISAGNSGTNTNWNFAAYPVYKNETFECLPSSSAPNGSSFPTSTLAYKAPMSAGDTLFTFVKDTLGGSSSMRFIVGSYENYHHTLLFYSVPEVIATLTVNHYNDSTSGIFVASGTLDSMGINGTIKRHGFFKMKYDAYGTLVTNYGTITLTGRVKTEEDWTDSIIISGNLNVKHTTVVTYDWYTSAAPGEKHAHIEHRVINGIASNFGYSNCPFCAVNEIAETQPAVDNLLLYPQPSNGKTHVQFNAPQSGNFSFYNNRLNGKGYIQRSSFYYFRIE